ncbi:MAG TPA: DUF1385 domain-containing protein [Abditibacteriaceae bacterium]|jgi:CBS domain-containing protein
MPFVRAGQLCRETPVVRIDDSLGLVAENLRESRYSAMPVIEGDLEPDGRPGRNSRVLGVVFERDLTRAVLPVLAQKETARRAAILATAAAASANGTQSTTEFSTNGASATVETPASAPQEITEDELRDVPQMSVRDVYRENAGFVPSMFSLHNTLLTLDRYDADALPVVDELGNYRGMIGRADVVAALGGQVRPPVVGGMATPLGVWLTTGHISAGAPPLGLMLSGATLFTCMFVAHLVLLFALTAVNQSWGAMFLSGRLGIDGDPTNSFNLVVTALESLLFLLVLRALPLSGIHAAEHQTVWAIERGVPLTPEFVGKMPRAHPRCGTNLVALGGLIQIILGHLPSVDPATVLISLLFIYITWRNFGTALQENFTTRPASKKQLESGIAAGKALLEKYQEQPHVELTFGARLWNSGMLLAAAGLIPAWLVCSLLENWIARLIVG